MNDPKDTGVGGLFQLPNLFGFGKKKKEKPKTDFEETDPFPLEKAKDKWKTAMRYKRSDQYYQATFHIR